MAAYGDVTDYNKKLKTSLALFKKLRKSESPEKIKKVKPSIVCDPSLVSLRKSVEPFLKNPLTLNENVIKKDIRRYLEAIEYCEFAGQYCNKENSSPESIKLELVLSICESSVDDSSADDRSFDEDSDGDNNLLPWSTKKLPHDRVDFRNYIKKLDPVDSIRLHKSVYASRVCRFVDLEEQIFRKQTHRAQTTFDTYLKKFVDFPGAVLKTESLGGNKLKQSSVAEATTKSSINNVLTKKPAFSAINPGVAPTPANSHSVACESDAPKKKKKKKKEKRKEAVSQAKVATKPSVNVVEKPNLTSFVNNIISQNASEASSIDAKEDYFSNNYNFTSPNKFDLLLNDNVEVKKENRPKIEKKVEPTPKMNDDVVTEIVSTREVKSNANSNFEKNEKTPFYNETFSFFNRSNESDPISLESDQKVYRYQQVNDLSSQSLPRDENVYQAPPNQSIIQADFKQPESVPGQRFVYDVVDLYSICPLFSTHDFCLACLKCHKIPENFIHLIAMHGCKRDIVLCSEKSSDALWQRVRPSSKRLGSYVDFCQAYPNCARSNNCGFAHSVLERLIWIKESKSGRKLIPNDFAADLCHSLVLSSSRRRDIPNVGKVTIWVGCEECATLIIAGYYSLFMFKHGCATDRVFCRDDQSEFWFWIRPRYHLAVSVTMCWHLGKANGIGCWEGGNCHFAHSQLEKTLWELDERRTIALASILNYEKKYWRENGPEFRCLPMDKESLLQNDTTEIPPRLKPSVNEHLASRNAYATTDSSQLIKPVPLFNRLTLDDLFVMPSSPRGQPPSSSLSSAKQPVTRQGIGNNEVGSTNSVPLNYSSSGQSEKDLGHAFSKVELKRQLDKELEDIFKKVADTRVKGNTLASTVDFAEIKTSAPLSVKFTAEDKGKVFHWVFHISTKISLKRVALLESRFFPYFALSTTDNRCILNPVISYGDVFYFEDHYEIRLNFFGSKTLGTFMQEIVFDFGPNRPLVHRVVHVNLGLQELQLYRLARLKTLINTNNYWTPDNVDVIWISNERNYKPPSANDILTNWRYEVNPSTYFPMLKKWVTAEEMRRRAILSEFRLNSEATLSLQINVDGSRSIKPFPEGALFAQINFDQPLNEEFDVTDLLMGYCQNAFVATKERQRSVDSKRKVYEVDVVGRYNFNYEGISQSSISLCLSVLFVRHNSLKPGQTIPLEIQFNIRHKDFAAWHYALEILMEKRFSSNFVFPDLSKQFLAYSSGVMFEEICARHPQIYSMGQRWIDEGKNEEQCRVLQHVVTCAFNRYHPVPPYVIFGPFGTGKTRTIAEAAALLLTCSEFAYTKILICAHSNSTADMYVKLLETFTGKSANELRQILWRIFPSKTTADSLPPHLRPYFREDPKFKRKQEKLTVEKFLQMRVVLCTFTGAHTLVKLVKNNPATKVFFTHIFLDEAAQALEVETLMPLCTATEHTSIIAAGDPHQLKPMIYLNECTQLNCSYLERLYYSYEKQEREGGQLAKRPCIPKVFFNKVYRCQSAILDFISKAFYGNLNLICKADARESLFQPVYFASAFGEDKLLPNSMSFSNNIEVMEVMSQVEYFWNNWPEAWGPKDIGIAVTQYDQMRLIQEQVRLKNYPSGNVHCGKVILFQGKEFKVLIVSTVRGRSILNGASYQKGKLGFLDDCRLINTAITRARYCVVVVGDPIALCSVGDCKKYWRRYVEFCFDRKTFLPDFYTFDLLKQHVKDAEAKMPSTLTST